ncbi:MAG: DUF3299 domain-containing protein [Lysobacterales bacterium]
MSRSLPSLPTPALLLALLTAGCQADEATTAPSPTATTSTPASVSAPAPTTSTEELRELDWMELMPADELQALQEAPPIAHDGSFKPLQQGSFQTVPGMDGLRVKLPGYIVPVESDADGKLLEFFLVPYFGACIHVPPPPPNQIIHGRLTAPAEMTDIYAAYWIEGMLHAERFQNDTAATAYTMTVDRVYLWE